MRAIFNYLTECLVYMIIEYDPEESFLDLKGVLE